jgi:hypothetical protein
MAVKDFKKQFGEEELAKVVKLHFKIWVCYSPLIRNIFLE